MDDSVIIKETFLTTNDNPFNPFKEFKEWFAYDQNLGYNTCGLIDRMFTTLFNVNEKEFDEETIEQMRIESMKHIIAIQPEIYKLVTNDTYVDTIPLSENLNTE